MRPLSFSLVLLVNILICIGVGYWLDQRWGTLPIFLLIGLAYSVIGSIIWLIHQGKKTHE